MTANRMKINCQEVKTESILPEGGCREKTVTAALIAAARRLCSHSKIIFCLLD